MSPQKVKPVQKVPTTSKASEEVVTQFWLSGRSNRYRGAIIPPSKLSQLLNPRWLPAPRNNTTRRTKVDSEPQSQSSGHTKLGRWYAKHLQCDWVMKKVCRLPPATLDRTFALVNDLVDEVSTSSEDDKVLPEKAAGLDPWEELMPPPANSESQITSFYSNLLYKTFLPALSMLLTRKHLNAVEHGECQNHPRFFKVANDTEDQSSTQSLRVMMRRNSTPRPDVLVSLETFEETRRAALFNERLSDKKNANPDKVAFTLDAVVPGLHHLALGETKAPNTDEGKALSGTKLPGSGAWNVPEQKCSCPADLMVPESHHDVDGNRSWEYNKIGQSRDIKREQSLWEALGATRPTPVTDVVDPQLGAHNKDSFFDLCNQVSPIHHTCSLDLV